MNRGKKSQRPFLGHEGIGARVELVRGERVWILRETLGSQFLMIATVGTVGFVPLWILVFAHEKVKGGIFAFMVLAVATMIGVRLFVRYLGQLLGKRRIEIDPHQQKLMVIESGNQPNRVFPLAEIRDLVLRTQDMPIRGRRANPSYSLLVLHLKDSSKFDIAASNDAGNLRTIHEGLRRLLPIA